MIEHLSKMILEITIAPIIEGVLTEEEEIIINLVEIKQTKATVTAEAEAKVKIVSIIDDLDHPINPGDQDPLINCVDRALLMSQEDKIIIILVDNEEVDRLVLEVLLIPEIITRINARDLLMYRKNEGDLLAKTTKNHR